MCDLMWPNRLSRPGSAVLHDISRLWHRHRDILPTNSSVFVSSQRTWHVHLKDYVQIRFKPPWLISHKWFGNHPQSNQPKHLCKHVIRRELETFQNVDLEMCSSILEMTKVLFRQIQNNKAAKCQRSGTEGDTMRGEKQQSLSCRMISPGLWRSLCCPTMTLCY